MLIDIPSITAMRGSFVDQFGIEWKLNSHGFRAIEFDQIDFANPRALAMGCSHTKGSGVDQFNTWPEVLKRKINLTEIINLGQWGASSDYIIRILPRCLEYFKPLTVFVFWPDWVRFEIFENNKYRQVTPWDEDRILYMETYTDEILKEKYNANLKVAQELCVQHDAKLIGISWDDLIPVLDHADKWNRGADGKHFDHIWQCGVAETFKQIYDSK